MSKDYQDNRKKLGAMLKSETPKTPIQEVRPVPSPEPVADAGHRSSHLNFWVEDQLMQRLKVYAAKSRKTIKQIGKEALEAYLKDHE